MLVADGGQRIHAALGSILATGSDLLLRETKRCRAKACA